MLRIESATLPDVDLTYIALRLSFFETLERITLARQLEVETDGAYGYLAEVPFLRNVAPQVQLDLLLCCWKKLRSHEDLAATLVDEAVLYAACETSARIVEADEQFYHDVLVRGPRQVSTKWDGSLADELRFLHLSLPNDGDFLIISQFQDVEPAEAARLKEKFGIDQSACEELFDVLGRWHVGTDFPASGAGLLDTDEMNLACNVLNLKPPAARS